MKSKTPKSHLSTEHKKLFDGKASERIVDVLLEKNNETKKNKNN